MAAKKDKTSTKRDKLAAYRDKRSASSTPEPFGSSRAGRGTGGSRKSGMFVVQKHAASRLHYDFRLEMDGVLVSWAVPRGPSLHPGDKRFAIHVEDHPLEYGDFEGVIPDGNYGAGSVIVWDRGRWQPIPHDGDGVDEGSLKFILFGHKLRGEFALVRTAKSKTGKEWLLLKKKDGYADPETPPAETSVFSGRTVEQVAEGAARADAVIELLETLGAPVGPVDPMKLELTLAESCDQPFSDDDWVFELKYDGYRMVAGCHGGEPVLRYRRGRAVTAMYPEIATALRYLPVDEVVLDGEVVVFDAAGRSDFSRLQQRAMLTRRSDISRATVDHPAVLMVFDIVAACGFDLRQLPQSQRRAVLEAIVPTTGVLRRVDQIPAIGEAFMAKVEEMDLEGVVGKRIESIYPGRRTADWKKIRRSAEHDFAVVGFTEPEGSRKGFRALHLAVWHEDRWVYAGRVGSGFSGAELKSIRGQLDELSRVEHAFDVDEPGNRTYVWVEPKLVVTVRYKEWREGRMPRQPTFVRLRTDKLPVDCTMPSSSQDDAPDAGAIDGEPERAVSLTNQDKVFWPAKGYTKGDLVDYYRGIFPWMEPYLRDRLAVLTRYPDGIEGKQFYQKSAPGWVPSWIRTATVWSEHSQRDIHYFVADDIESLTFLANLGTIPLHVWSSTATDLTHPDWSIIDLDPKGAPFTDVVDIARAIHRLLDDIALPHYVKTSGASGLHILIPLGRQCTFEQSRDLAGLIAKVIENEHGDIATMNRVIEQRQGKVYLDWLQNRHGQLLVAPFSVRPLPGAPVSMPLAWSEVNRKLDVSKYTIKTAKRRMQRKKADPMAAVLTDKPDLLAALERLAARLAP